MRSHPPSTAVLHTGSPVSSARARGVFRKRNWSISSHITLGSLIRYCSLDLRCLPPGTSRPLRDPCVMLHMGKVLLSALTSRQASVATSELPYRLPYRLRSEANPPRSPGVTRKSSVPCRRHTPWCARGDAKCLRLHSAAQLPHLTLWQYRDFLGQWSKWLA